MLNSKPSEPTIGLQAPLNSDKELQSKIKRRVSAWPQIVEDRSAKKLHDAIHNILKDRNYINLSFSQKSALKKAEGSPLLKSSTKDLRFDPK